MLFKAALPFLLPTVLVAANIDVSIANSSGQSSYIVSSDFGNLKSKLRFPFKYSAASISYHYPLEHFKIGMFGSLILHSFLARGEDYDWQKSNLTVYSHSISRVENYSSIGARCSRGIFKNTLLFAQFEYRNLDISWSDTYQQEYKKEKSAYVLGKALEFNQEFFIYTLGVKYRKKISKRVSFEFAPMLHYNFINTKDNHILRGFFVQQSMRALGYGIDCTLAYKMTTKSVLKIAFDYTNVKKRSVTMRYYNSAGINYLKYPSSYNYRNNTIVVDYSYRF